MHLEPFMDLRLAKAHHPPELEARETTRLEPVEHSRRRERQVLCELSGGEEAIAHGRASPCR